MEEELEGLYQAMRCETLMLQSKLIEHILDGDEGWREAIAGKQLCPTMQSAIRLREQIETLRTALQMYHDTIAINTETGATQQTTINISWAQAIACDTAAREALASLSSPAPEKTPQTREIPTVTTTTPAPPKVMSRHFGQTFLSVQLSCGHSRSYKAPPLPEIGETVACYECEVAHLKTQETPAVEDEGGKAAKPKRYFANQCPDCGHCDCSQHFDEDSGTFFTCCSCGTSFSYPNPPASPSLPSPSATPTKGESE